MACVTAVAGADFMKVGYGDGSGSGSGSGYGDGSGSGSGYGDGSGENFGVAAFCGDPVQRIDGIATILRSIHGNAAMGDILRGDLTLKKCYVVKGAGFFAHGETLSEAQEALEQKIMENMPIEQKISKFMENFKPGMKYPAKEFYAWHNTLTGSCEMGRKEFAREHGIDIENDAMTPEEFIKLTENAYGGAIIRQLKAAMME